MALSVVDLYAKILPRTNCKECGFSTCIAFAGMVVSEKHPLKNCPHIDANVLASAQAELEQQYKEGRWLKKDMAQEALEWAKKKAASMTYEDICNRIGGSVDAESQISLPYFNQNITISSDGVFDSQGNLLSRNEQTFVYIHMAQGGTISPSGNMKSFKEFPNTVSKIVSMKDQVEDPLKKAFQENAPAIKNNALALGGRDVSSKYPSSDFALAFDAFPKVPVVVLFWKANDGFDADAKLLFDETITAHLDIEAIMFLSETLCKELIQ